MPSSNYENVLSFAQKKHAGQVLAGNTPTWHHLLRVSRLLESVLNHTQEGSAEEREVIRQAALCHDILEDTDATQEQLAELLGNRGLELVKGMTNWWGDTEKKKYIAQMIASEEAVRVIKLSDLYDNITNVSYNLHVLGVPWANSFFLPIVTPMRQELAETTFATYQKSAEILSLMVRNSARQLDEEITYFGK